MKQVSNNFKDFIRTYGRQFDHKLKINDIDISPDDIYYLKPKFNISLFKTVMKSLEIDYKYNIASNSKINLKSGAKLNDNPYEYIEYGNYYSIKDSTLNEDTNSYTNILYDKMVESMIDYDLQINELITVREYLLKICNRLSWNTDNIPAQFINSTKLVNPMLHQDIGYTFRDVLDEIATITFSFFLFKNDSFYMIYPSLSNEIIDESYLDEDKISINEKVFFNSLVFSRAEDSDSIYRKDFESIEINGLHEYKISDNQLLSTNDRDNFIDEMFNYLKTFEFYSFDIQSKGIFFLDPCDMFNFKLSGKLYKVLLLNDEISFEDGAEEYLYTDAPEETVTDYKSADLTDKKINQAYILVDKQNQKITQLTNNVSEYGEKLAQVEQTVDEISQKVENIEEFSRETTGIDEILLENTAKGKNLILNLKIYGNTDIWKYLVPSEDLVPSETLAPSGDGIVIVCDDRSRSNKSDNAKEYEIQISEPLRNIGDICDELDITNNKATIIRRIGINASGELYVLNVEQKEELDDVFLETFDENTYVYVKEYGNLKYYSKYIIDSDYVELFATQDNLQSAVVDLNSSITQTAEEINLEVSKKVGNDEIISKINQSAEEVNIQANKINLEGYTTINGSFKVNENGELECSGGLIELYDDTSETNAKLKITGSKNVSMLFGNGLIVGEPTDQGTYLGRAVMHMEKDGTYTFLLHDGVTSDGVVDITPGRASFSNWSRFYVGCDITQGSKEELKKNFEMMQNNAINILKEIDIYRYNLKNEKDTDKKHIGFVIGDNYKYSKEVTSKDNDGVNIYSFVSLCCKAIQEQQVLIENLQKEVEELKNGEN